MYLQHFRLPQHLGTLDGRFLRVPFAQYRAFFGIFSIRFTRPNCI